MLIKSLMAITLATCSMHLQAYLYPFQTPVTNYLKPIAITEHDSGLPYIDCIYVINLDSRADRWHRLQPVFEKMGISPNRVSAYVGKTITKEQKLDMFGPYPIRMPGPAIGCLLSHLSIIKDAYERGFSAVWIMEDDVEFLENAGVISKLMEDLTEIDSEWDFLYTDTNCRNPEGGYYYTGSWEFARPDQNCPPYEVLNQRISVGSDFEITNMRYGLTSYILTRSGIEKLYRYFTHVFLWVPVDVDIHYIPGIRKYGVTRDVVTNNRIDLGSDIRNSAWDNM